MKIVNSQAFIVQGFNLQLKLWLCAADFLVNAAGRNVKAESAAGIFRLFGYFDLPGFDELYCNRAFSVFIFSRINCRIAVDLRNAFGFAGICHQTTGAVNVRISQIESHLQFVIAESEYFYFVVIAFVFAAEIRAKSSVRFRGFNGCARSLSAGIHGANCCGNGN